MQVGAVRRGRRCGIPPGVSFLQENTDSEAKHQHEDEADQAEPADHAMRVDLARCTIGALEGRVALRRALVEGFGHGARVATGDRKSVV